MGVLYRFLVPVRVGANTTLGTHRRRIPVLLHGRLGPPAEAGEVAEALLTVVVSVPQGQGITGPAGSTHRLAPLILGGVDPNVLGTLLLGGVDHLSEEVAVADQVGLVPGTPTTGVGLDVEPDGPKVVEADIVNIGVDLALGCARSDAGEVVDVAVLDTTRLGMGQGVFDVRVWSTVAEVAADDDKVQPLSVAQRKSASLTAEDTSPPITAATEVARKAATRATEATNAFIDRFFSCLMEYLFGRRSHKFGDLR
jgi:hypothetical protein